MNESLIQQNIKENSFKLDSNQVKIINRNCVDETNIYQSTHLILLAILVNTLV